MVKNWLTADLKNVLTKTFRVFSIILLILTLFLLSTYLYQRITLFKKSGHQLQKIANNRRHKILSFIDSQKKQTATLIQNKRLLEAFSKLKELFDPNQKLFPNEQSAEYKQEENNIDQYFDETRLLLPYRDLLFVNPEGIIFYTNKIDVVGDGRLFGPELAKGMVTQSFDRTRITFTPDLTEFGIGLLSKEPALYLVRPIFVENKYLGAVVIWLNQDLLYNIIQDYSDLGRSGDIFLVRNIGDRVIFVSPSRLYQNIEFKKISPADKYALTPERKAAIGQEGFGDTVNSFGMQVIASWLFVPQLNVGLTVELQKSEVLQCVANKLFWLKILFSILFLCLLFHLYQINHHLMRRAFVFIFSRKTLRTLFLLGFITGIFVSGFLIWNHYHTYQKIFEHTKQLAKTKIRTQAAIINQYIIEIEKIAQMIGQNLKTNALKKEDIPIRISRDLKEIPNITSITVAFAPFKYDPSARLFALRAARNESSTIEVKQITEDYMIPGSEREPETGWYDRAVNEGAFWSDSFMDEKTKKQSVLYATPFYLEDSESPDGVIAIIYQLDKIISDVSSIEIGKTGYAVLLSSKIQFLHHPLSQYVKEKISILDIVQEQNNLDLKNIADQMKKGISGFGSYYDPISKLKYWISFEPIPANHWTIAASFSEESLDLPSAKLYKQRIWIFISFVIALLFLIMFLTNLESFTFYPIRNFAIFSTILFALSLITFLTIIRKTAYQPKSDVTVIRDEISTDKFLEFLNLETAQRNEKKPIPVPIGLIINTLVFQNSSKISITGYIWQRISKSQNIVAGLRFPEALETTVTEVLRKTEGDTEIIGWNVKGSFLQKIRYSWFPFDRIHIDILIGSADFENNIILVPDFSSYKSLDIDPLPGINNKMVVPGFDLERSFFSFSRLPLYNEIGLETLRKVTDMVETHYNVILQRKLINPLIIYFLPLLIILFSIYAVFLIAFISRLKFDAFKSLTSYTALFFSLIILHQTLRSQYQSGELLYVEYFFFFTYITILFLILYALMLKVGHIMNFMNTKVSPYLRLLFWPIQFVLWFTITMIIFYVIR